MRVVDQMRAFAAADVVVAAQGAALSNIVFCRPGTRVISLARIEIKGVDVFTWLARELSLDLQNVVAAQLAPDESVSDPDSVRQDFEISPDAVEAALRAVDIV
jgi:capsular polysaccharide biosynthesis protein